MRGRRRWLFALVVCSAVTGVWAGQGVSPKPAIRKEVGGQPNVAVSRGEIVLPRDTTREPAIAAAHRRLERSEDEWDGMPVDEEDWPCVGNGSCSMARACVAGRCVACASDDACERGELCVLQHCVPGDQVECRVVRDCRADELCVLSGITADDPRGNRDMRATCQAPWGGSADDPEQAYRESAEARAQDQALDADVETIEVADVPGTPVIMLDALRAAL